MPDNKPIAVFRLDPSDGPGYLGTFLTAKNLPWQLICVDQGDAIPRDVTRFAGLVFMGGAMSVNDDLPWIEPVLDRIQAAVATDVPVMGHCLGGQLLSRALGGAVTANPVQEIGWHKIRIADNDAARHWFGHVGDGFLSFHWHNETFSIPAGATAIMSSAHCANQGFALGPHLGMQCHIEMQPFMVLEWCESEASSLLCEAQGANIQTPDQMRDQLVDRITQLHLVADGVYEQWIKGLRC
jgi:GMP synthase-like glutamine amidotransferase